MMGKKSVVNSPRRRGEKSGIRSRFATLTATPKLSRNEMIAGKLSRYVRRETRPLSFCVRQQQKTTASTFSSQKFATSSTLAIQIKILSLTLPITFGHRQKKRLFFPNRYETIIQL